MLVTLDARCRGSSHIKDGKPCQDFSGSTTDKWKSYAYALVADGHGGERYIRSAEGSRLAVLCSVEAINKVLKELVFYIKKKEVDVIDKSLKNLCSRLLLLWREKVKSHFAENPLAEEEKSICEKLKIELSSADNEEADLKIFELYGSTLLSAVYFENFNFWFALQIGDGKTFILNEDGAAVSPKELENEKAAFGVTPSLCGKTAIEEFRYAYGFEKISGVCVMSDGMTDSFDLEKLPDFLLNIKNNAIADVEKTKNELTAYLPTLSEQGSGDDISIAGIFVKEEEKQNMLDKLRKKII